MFVNFESSAQIQEQLKQLVAMQERPLQEHTINAQLEQLKQLISMQEQLRQPLGERNIHIQTLELFNQLNAKLRGILQELHKEHNDNTQERFKQLTVQHEQLTALLERFDQLTAANNHATQRTVR